jgi:hypothetical protein
MTWVASGLPTISTFLGALAAQEPGPRETPAGRPEAKGPDPQAKAKSGEPANNDLPYMNYLPSYAAAAWYHKKLPDELQRLGLTELLKEVEGWVDREYAAILVRGDRLPMTSGGRLRSGWPDTPG